MWQFSFLFEINHILFVYVEKKQYLCTPNQRKRLRHSFDGKQYSPYEIQVQLLENAQVRY